MNKIILKYIAVLIIGIFIGWLVFSGNSSHKHTEKKDETSDVQWWTCSMHPQIKQPDSGDCPICAMDLIPMNANGTQTGPGQIEMSKSAIKLAGIETTTVEYSLPEKEIFLQGKIEFDERRISTQSVHFSGRIEKLYISFEGEKVFKGQKLAEIYSPDLISAQKELFEAIKNEDTYPQLFEAAKNKLKLLKLGEKQIEEIIKTGKVNEYFDIYSDVSGYISKRNVSVGDYVKAGDAVFTIVNLDKVWVVFDVFEKDIPFFKKGDLISFSVSSLGSQRFESKIDYIDPVIDKQKRTTQIRTELRNNGKLKPEMFVSGKITANLSHKKNALTVPKSSVMWTGKRSIVYVKVPKTTEPVFELREVILGEPLGMFYIIEKGLKIGEEIVTKGTYTIDAAAQLNNKYSMMNPPENLIEDIPDFSNEINNKLLNSYNRIIINYLAIKESLIAADAKGTIREAKKMLKNISDFNEKNLDINAREFWQLKIKTVIKELEKMASTENIDSQRKHFKPFSDEMIKIIKSFGYKNEKIYVQFCPMADNDKGGFWLSTEKQISNPYFGDMMLRCGEVKDSIYKIK